jgi:hypothetical protein
MKSKTFDEKPQDGAIPFGVTLGVQNCGLLVARHRMNKGVWHV